VVSTFAGRLAAAAVRAGAAVRDRLTQVIENAAVAVMLAPLAARRRHVGRLPADAVPARRRDLRVGGVRDADRARVDDPGDGPRQVPLPRLHAVLGLPFALLTWLVTSLLLPLLHPLRG
jgi:hypothetical protein